uniref:Uncharacterized protein n=1 Tax=viral metagenome TaxID=1070528 RepID=A0A6M3IMG2_9ZZZZ
MKYLSSVLAILSAVLMAFYSYYSIKGLTATLAWHLFQWTSCAMLMWTGFEFGRWYIWDANWHDFGRIVGIAVLAIPLYVFLLHALL